MTEENLFDNLLPLEDADMNDLVDIPEDKEEPEKTPESKDDEKSKAKKKEDSESEDVEETEEDEVEATDEENEEKDSESEDSESDEDDSDSGDEKSGKESIFEEFNKLSGYDIDFSELPEDSEGIVKYSKILAKEMAKEEKDSEFETMPDLKEYYEYRKAGGNPDTYFQTKFPEKDFEEIKWDKEDENLHKEVIREYYSKQGYANKYISDKIKRYEDSGILEEESKDMFEILKNEQRTKKETLLEEQKRTQEKQLEDISKYWSDVKTSLESKNDLYGIPIPEKEKSKFFDYMAKPADKTGRFSQAALKYNELTPEQRMTIDYIIYKDFKIEGLINNRAKSLASKKLREVFNSKKDSKKVRGKSTNSKNSDNEGDIDNLQPLT